MMTSDSWCFVIISSGITDMAFSNALKFSSVLIHYKTLKLQLTPSGSDYLLFCFWCHNLACFQYSCSLLNKCLYVVCASVYMPLCAWIPPMAYVEVRGQLVEVPCVDPGELKSGYQAEAKCLYLWSHLTSFREHI